MKSGSTPRFVQHFRPLNRVPSFVTHWGCPSLQQLWFSPIHEAGTTCSHSSRLERFSFLLAVVPQASRSRLPPERPFRSYGQPQ